MLLWIVSFCAASGKKISVLISSIAFSSGVDEAMTQKISRVSGIPIKPDLEKYLRVPFIMSRTNMGLFSTSYTGLTINWRGGKPSSLP